MADPIAIYGALIGTAGAIGAGWNIYHSAFRDRAKLTVEAKFETLYEDGQALDCVGIKVRNLGRRPATIASCSFRRADGSGSALIPGWAPVYGALGLIIDDSHKLPKRLEEGESHDVLYPLAGYQDAEGRICEDLHFAEVVDGAGNRWTAKLSPAIIRALRPREQQKEAIRK